MESGSPTPRPHPTFDSLSTAGRTWPWDAQMTDYRDLLVNVEHVGIAIQSGRNEGESVEVS
jgi:hypothetical protein